MTGVIAVPSLHPSAIAITVDVLVAEGYQAKATRRNVYGVINWTTGK
jgi:hypothetical protein